MSARNQYRYQEIFEAEFGPFPHECRFCGGTVMPRPGRRRDSPVVHHIDGDYANNDPSNLAPGHKACHHIHHNKGRKLSPEHCAKISAALRGRKQPAGHLARMNAARLAVPVSLETRAKISAAQKGKPKTAEQRAKMSAAQKERRKKARTTLWYDGT